VDNRRGTGPSRFEGLRQDSAPFRRNRLGETWRPSLSLSPASLIRPHGSRPIAFPVALERVKVEARAVNSLNRSFGVGLERFSIKPTRHRHCERSEAIQGPQPLPYDHWIASSLRSSQRLSAIEKRSSVSV
jgi:hypothetical protein